MKKFLKAILILATMLLFTACGPKSFPSDNLVYDSPKNYEYPFTAHTYNSKDSTKLYGYHIRTKHENPKGLIVIANGMRQNMSFRFTEWLWILEAGYNLFIFDYRSYGDSKAEANLQGFVEDVESSLEYAHSLEKDKNIVIVGQSMGGTFVIDALKNKTYPYLSFAVIDSTFTGFDDVMSGFMLKSMLLIPFAWLPYITVPTELNAENNIEYLKTPTLFIAGDADFVVDYKDSISLYEDTKAKKALWIIKGAEHVQSFNNLNVRDEFLKVLEDNSLLFKKQKRTFN